MSEVANVWYIRTTQGQCKPQKLPHGPVVQQAGYHFEDLLECLDTRHMVNEWHHDKAIESILLNNRSMRKLCGWHCP